jgi:hypothetical protein
MNKLLTFAIGFSTLLSNSSAQQVSDEELLKVVTDCIDNLLEHGRDEYGDVHSAMLMSVMDVRTNTSPREPETFGAMIRSEGRLHRRNPGGVDLWEDQPLIRTMYTMGELHGKSKYVKAADAYIKAFFEHAVKPNGLNSWGSHIFYDAYTDAPGGDNEGTGPHETLVLVPEWERMWEASPEQVLRQIDNMWIYHLVDRKSGMFNRHDDNRQGCDFAFFGGEMAYAFSFAYSKTGKPRYLNWAKTIANRHWNARNPDTNLAPDAPSTGARYDAHHSFTTITGPYAALLMKCYEATGDEMFRDQALAYLHAYLKYGWDAEAKQWRAMLALDGTPIMQQDKGAGYDVWKPTGYIDIWRTVMFSYEFPILAAQSALYAYEITGDLKALESAKHWAVNIDGAMPPAYGRRWGDELEAAIPGSTALGGTYAENYGRTISFFLGLHEATKEKRHLDMAHSLARNAIDKLVEYGWVKGQPAKPYYENTDGVGFLLYSFVQLAEYPKHLKPNL